MSEDRGGGMWGIRPAQTSRRVESEATEHKLPVKQTITGALSLCVVVALFVAILTLIDLPAILCVALAMAAVRVLRGIEFVAWWSALVFVAVLFCAVALMTGVVSNASVGGALLALLRTVWLPTDYDSAWLAGIDGRLVLWSRGTLVVMSLCAMFFAANLAYRMAIEVFNPNWPPTFTAALAELGPLWWTWKPKPTPPVVITKTRTVVRTVDGRSSRPDAQGIANGVAHYYNYELIDLAEPEWLDALAHALNEGGGLSRDLGKRCGWSDDGWRTFCEQMVIDGIMTKPNSRTYIFTAKGELFMEAFGFERKPTLPQP